RIFVKFPHTIKTTKILFSSLSVARNIEVIKKTQITPMGPVNSKTNPHKKNDPGKHRSLLVLSEGLA
ncbi:MAG: hypothetical protein ACHP6I_00335, partial [Rickettsiales bacterium]